MKEKQGINQHYPESNNQITSLTPYEWEGKVTLSASFLIYKSQSDHLHPINNRQFKHLLAPSWLH